MGRSLILETTYLVDREREIRRGEPGPARELLDREESPSLLLTFTITEELTAGTSPRSRER